MLDDLTRDGMVRLVTVDDQKAFPLAASTTLEIMPFPLVVVPTNAAMMEFSKLCEWLISKNVLLEQIIESFGAILFRGFPVPSAVEFNDFVESLGVQPLPYVGGAAPRTCIHKAVFTSNESPPSEPIPFHHEMAQVPTYPSQIFFYCDLPSSSGGATPILRSDILCDRLTKLLPEFIRALEEKGVKYTRILPAQDDPSSAIGRSWSSTYLTDDPKEAQEKANALGVSLEWLPNGDVKSVSSKLPAIKMNPRDGQTRLFFNSMIAAYTGWRDSRNDPAKAVSFGDGTPLDKVLIERVCQEMEAIKVTIPWEKNDVLCVSNHLCMHSREAFDPPRRVLAYVAK
jgi:alpha-ketoglutarate-dependent taurine dioxygenase